MNLKNFNTKTQRHEDAKSEDELSSFLCVFVPLCPCVESSVNFFPFIYLIPIELKNVF